MGNKKYKHGGDMLSPWLVIFVLGNKFNFNKYNRGTIDSLGTKYDYGSVMHYGSRAFSKNGRPTIVSKKSGVSRHKCNMCLSHSV